MDGVNPGQNSQRKLQHPRQLEEPVRGRYVGRRREEPGEGVAREAPEVECVLQEVIVPALEDPDPRHRCGQYEKPGRHLSGSASSPTGPAMAIGTDGAAHTVWYNGKPGDAGVYYARSGGDGGSTGRVGLVSGPEVGTAHAAVAPLRDGGALAAYDVSADGKRRITVARVSSSGALAGQVEIADSDDGKYPQLAVLGDSAALVAWTSATGEKPRVRLARLTLR